MKAPLLFSVLLLGTSFAFTASASAQGKVGDVNGDGVVNCLDVNLVYAALGRSTGQYGYSTEDDLNGDGVINVKDLSIVARNVPAGTVCPENKYQAAGEQFLDQLNNAFFKSAGGLGLYAEDINGSTGARGANAFLFSTDYLINALYEGARVDPKYQANLASLIGATSWYKATTAYGVAYQDTKGGAAYFDDNALLGGILMKVYLNELPQQTVLDESLLALNYVYSHRDAQGGVPQLPKELGNGTFYLGPSIKPSIAYAEHYVQTGDSSDLTPAEGYFTEVNDPALGLIGAQTGLFISGTTYNSSTGTWNPDKVGPLAGNSTEVIELALALYRATGDGSYLTYAQNLLTKVVKRYYIPGGGVKEISVYGGSGIVDVLCQMYQIDHNIVWYNDAKDIVDFLLNDARDTAGWFPDGTAIPAGNWNVVRTGQPPDAKVTVITQAAAAVAILEFAYTDIHKPM